MKFKRINLNIYNRALKNIWRKKFRTVLVALALAFTIASIASVFAGIDSTNNNTQELIDNSELNTQKLIDGVKTNTQLIINQTLNDTAGLIDNVIGNTQEMINDTLTNTEAMIQSIEESFQEMENESEIQMTKITVSNLTSSRPPGYSEISETVIMNISGMEGVHDQIPLVERSYGIDVNSFDQGSGGGKENRPSGGYKRMTADYVIEGIPLDHALNEIYHLLPLDIINGSNLNESDSMKVVIHQDLTDYFNASIGDPITIEETEFEIIGLYFSAIQNTSVFMNIDDARTIFNLDTGSANIIDVYANNVSVVDNITDEIGYYYPDFNIEAFKDSYASSAEYVKKQQDKQIDALNDDANSQITELENNRDIQITELETAQEEQIDSLEEDKEEQIIQVEKDQATQVVDMEDDMTLLETIGNLIIIVSAVSTCMIIVVMMFYTVKERTVEIGIFKALGFKNYNIISQFLIEGLLIGLIGSGLGILISMGAGPLLSDLMLPSSDIYSSSRPDLNLVLIIIGLTVFFSSIGSFIPSFRATRKRAAEAIRNE